ncbi:hypothetical protein BD408DRAFT_426049 [Parasitella parasitica]|nr:hypothetical protein BD408DRAFT_426049 [Parasitella parasitica]
MLLLYTLMLNHLQSKRVQFVFIIARTILCTALILVPITRKQYTGWRVSSAIVHSGIIIYYVFEMGHFIRSCEVW